MTNIGSGSRERRTLAALDGSSAAQRLTLALGPNASSGCNRKMYPSFFSQYSQIKMSKRLLKGTRIQEMTSTLLKMFWERT